MSKIGTLSAVLAALGSAGATVAKADIGSLAATELKFDASQLLVGKELSKYLLTDKLVISKILVGSKLVNVATGYNQTNEYTQGGGSDSFRQYSQTVSRTPLDRLVLSTSMLSKLKTLNYIR
ncbi:hypothetical protein [Oligoflexus sp.]|uniref:hypothetical protein n=1 Tax=Oligoflexus sp. TaxID=1971216 RepID=UPI002D7A120F|nr:hypothetical protein [Oligoflexus sp.]